MPVFTRTFNLNNGRLETETQAQVQLRYNLCQTICFEILGATRTFAAMELIIDSLLQLLVKMTILIGLLTLNTGAIETGKPKTMQRTFKQTCLTIEICCIQLN